MTTTPEISKLHARMVTVLALLICFSHLVLSARAASISEPETIFYGKVLAANASRPFLVTEGQLTWVVRRADGQNLVLRTQLKSLNNGEYSYRLNVPHEALAAGLQATTAGVPLGAVDTTQTHLMMDVDGIAARLLGPNGATFDAAQARRTATYRLDLLVGMGAGDSDGNGLPDWWETKYGLNDPNGDRDGDGWSNLTELRKGSNPEHDDRIPTLLTREVRAYAEGTSAVLIRALDADSTTSNLVYTVTRLPEAGALWLRNGSDPSTPITAGTTFTQADVDRAQVIYVHGTTADEPSDSFQVVLRDESPEHPASTNVVFVHLYKPGHSVALGDLMDASLSLPRQAPNVAGFIQDEQRFVMSYLLSRDLDYVIADGSSDIYGLNLLAPSAGLTAGQYTNTYVAAHGRDRKHVLLGGLGSDVLGGTMESDVIVGGPGNDIVRGNGGADLFLLGGRDDGNDVIEDFNPAENDVIDLSAALTGSSRWLTNYLQVVSTSTNTVLRVNCGGTGGSFTNLTVTFANSAVTASNLVALVESGNIVTGEKGFAPRISLVATVPVASENGPTAGRFTLSRTGSTRDPLTVNLQITGPAGNGTDYYYIAPQVTFLSGERSLVLDVVPYQDAVTELNEIVDIVVLAAPAYELTSSYHAQVTIEDLKPEITIEAVEPIAIKTDLTPGYFLITRENVLDRSVFVQLNISGTALNGTDYQSIPAFVNFSPYQTTALISVTPKSTGVLSNGIEFVQLSVRTNSAYKLGLTATSRVMIVEQQMTFDSWKERFFPGSSTDLSAFGSGDAGQKGVQNLQRYAFGLDPTSPQLSRGAPRFKVLDNHLTVAFRRPYSVTQVQYVIEVSDDLVSWHSGTEWWEPYVIPEYANDVEVAGYRSKQTMDNTPKLFMRVRVIYAP